MKICHVTNVHDVTDVRILKKECVSLAKIKSYEVHLVGPGENDAEINGVKIHGCGLKPLSRIKRMTSYAKDVIEKAGNIDADIYHIHDPELLRFALKLKKNGKKIIFDSHENIVSSIDQKAYLPFVLRKIFKAYYQYLQNMVIPRINGVVIVSPQMKRDYDKLNDCIALIPNFPLISQNITNNKEIKIEKGRFIFAGGVSKLWSHEEIVKAFNSIDEGEFYIFGDGDKDFIEHLKALNTKNRVYFGGKVPFEKAQYEIAKSQFAIALLKPCQNSFWWEGTLGNTKLFEAMGKGKPIIATKFHLWKEIVEGNGCGICIDPNSTADIKKAIKFMLNCNQDEIEEMSNNGVKAIHEKYNWNVCEQELYRFYERILSDN